MSESPFVYSGSPTFPAQPPFEQTAAHLHQPSISTGSSQAPSLRMLEGSTNFTIKNSVLTNAQNVTVYRFDVGDTLSEEFKTMFRQYMAGFITVKDMDKMERYSLTQVIRDLPRVNAAYDDYTSSSMRRVTCFEGTRQALLEEIAQWFTSLDGPRAYLIFGIAGIGKSTVMQTVAERANNIRLLGASFFFSRDEVERSTAKHFFTTIAFQLCLCDQEFAQAIEKALLTERGLAAITKDPITQLEALILEPLQGNSRPLPTLIVVDALDECDNHDALVVLAALSRLVQELPCFKVIMTTRPEPYLPSTLSSHKVIHLQNIEDKTVDSDIQHYLKHNLSWRQVVACMPHLSPQWSASDVEIDSLVQAAGRLFIMASTAVRFILDTTAYDPGSQMEAMKTDGRVSLNGLGEFYNVILRRAVPPNEPRVALRFKIVIGTILVVQEPLPIGTLEHLTRPYSLSGIGAVLANLKSVIMANDDTPRFYHKSFFDYLTSPDRCAEDLLIDMKEHHTRLATRCFEIMNSSLRQNILDLGTPARFMNNDAGLAADNISAERLAEKIPDELRYACVHWANHIERGDPEDASLVCEVDIFIGEHLLHWLEALCWIGKLDIATHTLRVITKSMKSGSSNTHGIVSDALLFIPKFYELIRRSALHTYYSALPFTMTESLLFKSYSKEMAQCLCQTEGVPAQWDPLIAHLSPDSHFLFSHDSSKIASSSLGRQEMTLLDAENGSVLRTFKGNKMSIAHDFSAVAVAQGSTVTLWNVASNVAVTTVTQSERVVKLALSFDGTRLAASLSNGTINLWDTLKGEMIASPVEHAYHDSQLEFAPSGYRIAFISGDRTIQLWDGHNGKLVARLDYGLKAHGKFIFSHNGCHVASLVEEVDSRSLTLWSGNNGNLIGVADEVWGNNLAISEDGSFTATIHRGFNKLKFLWSEVKRAKSESNRVASLLEEPDRVKLWGRDPFSVLDTLDVWEPINHLAISRGVLAIGGENIVKLYDINNRAFIFTIHRPDSERQHLALSPDCTRLAVGTKNSGLLYDIPSLKAIIPASSQQDSSRVLTLAFSSDSTRLASGCRGGTVQLWDTSHTVMQQIASQKLHSGDLITVAFSHGGDQFASGSDDKTVRLWDGRNGAPVGKLEHVFTGTIWSLAFSYSLIAAATDGNITLFDFGSLRVVDTLQKGGCSLSFSADGSYLASAAYNNGQASDVTVWSVEGRISIAVFKVDSGIKRLLFSSDGSQVAAQSTCYEGSFKFFDIVNKCALELTGHEDLRWIPNFLNGALVSWKWDCATSENHLVGRFLGHAEWVPILCIPREFDISCFAVGSSMVALGCYNTGRILLMRF